MYPPEGKNGLEHPLLFEERLRYKRESFSYLYGPVPLDIIYEKPFYGKVDIYGNTVYPSMDGSLMKSIGGQGLIRVVNPVADAFLDLKTQIDSAITGKAGYFAELFPSYTPKSGYRNFHDLYNHHYGEKIYEVFANDYLSQKRVDSRIKNLGDYVKEYVAFARSMKSFMPITRTGYIMSPSCPSDISGLIINLDLIDMGDDTIKYIKYLSKPAFADYVKTAASFGFYVDKNAPNRIAFNLDQKEAQPYIQAYNLSVHDNSFFDLHYYNSIGDGGWFSYYDFISRMWNGYHMLILDAGTHSYGSAYTAKNCIEALWNPVENNKYETQVKDKLRESLTSTDPIDPANANLPEVLEFYSRYPHSFWLENYFHLRIFEKNSGHDPTRIYGVRNVRSAIKKIMRINRARGPRAAVALIERLTKQSNIYVKDNSIKSFPHKIGYLGKNISSGLHSYEKFDKLTEEEMKQLKPAAAKDILY